ncbi:MAG: FAD-dependent oxidoreductase [Pseudomonadota bacterium]
MSCDPRYEILFESIKIGPHIAKNRFYQVPHCNGMGFDRPHTQAKMREMKAEGGWAVVCTEENMIHPTSDGAPIPQCRLWDDKDVKCLEIIVEAIHRHDALAGTELVHHGIAEANLYSRMAPIAPSHQPVKPYFPIQGRQMDKTDIKAFRKWHRKAAIRAKQSGVDIIYVYAGHDLALIQHFLSKRRNHRTDEYGGSLKNRARLLKEILEETKDAVGDKCAVALRLAVHELSGSGGIDYKDEGRDIVELLSDLPDLWDVNISDVPEDCATSRFKDEGHEEEFISFVKQITAKPVVGVGRFTSPDTMVSQVRRGIMDFIGCARPSIADPFLPKKILENRLEEIRECIGCNICLAGNFTATPMRCTQNPTIGEEWRRGWHPEKVEPKKSNNNILIVGAGPAGLEAARVLGQRNYNVILSESGRTLGGRVLKESMMPGLSVWARFIDYRSWLIKQLSNVTVYFDSHLEEEDIFELGFQSILIATGAKWRRDGFGRFNTQPISGWQQAHVVSATDVLAGKPIKGSVVVFDDDHYYLGGVIAQHLKKNGHKVTIVTPASDISAWTRNTAELTNIQRQILEQGIDVEKNHNIIQIDQGEISLACIYTGRTKTLKADSIVMVTSRVPDDSLYYAVTSNKNKLNKAGIETVKRIGDCYCPGIIATAAYDGYRAAMEMDTLITDDVPFRRERVVTERSVK